MAGRVGYIFDTVKEPENKYQYTRKQLKSKFEITEARKVMIVDVCTDKTTIEDTNS